MAEQEQHPHLLARRLAFPALWLVPIVVLSAVANTVPSIVRPDLQTDTFGGDKFLYTGLVGGLKGACALFLSPFLGFVADRYGRRLGLCLAAALPIIAPLVFAVTECYVAFAVIDAVCGVWPAVNSIAMAAAMDLHAALAHHDDTPESSVDVKGVAENCDEDTQQRAGEGDTTSMPDPRARHRELAVMSMVFGALMMFYLAGNTAAAHLGNTVSRRSAFTCAAIVGGLLQLYLWLIYPEDIRSPASSRLGRMLHLVGVAKPSASQPEETNTAITTSKVEGGATFGPTCNDTSALLGAERLDVRNNTSIGPDEKAAKTPPLYLLPKSLVIRSWTLLRRRPQLAWLLLISFLNAMGEMGLQVLSPLYMKHRVHFSDSDREYASYVVTAASAVSLLLVTPLLTRFAGIPWTLRVCIGVNVLHVGLTSVVTHRWENYALCASFVFVMGVYPTMGVAAAQSVEGDHDGALAQGLVSASRMVAEGLSPAFIGPLLHVTKHTAFPGVPFLFLSCFVAAGCALTIFVRR